MRSKILQDFYKKLSISKDFISNTDPFIYIPREKLIEVIYGLNAESISQKPSGNPFIDAFVQSRLDIKKNMDPDELRNIYNDRFDTEYFEEMLKDPSGAAEESAMTYNEYINMFLPYLSREEVLNLYHPAGTKGIHLESGNDLPSIIDIQKIQTYYRNKVNDSYNIIEVPALVSEDGKFFVSHTNLGW